MIRASTAMPLGPAIAPPPGYVAFCSRDPDQCAPPSSGVPVIALASATWHTVEQVNTSWNTTVKPLDYAAHYGRVDYWTIPKDGYGDCEDYALTKRKDLLDAGLPASNRRTECLAAAVWPLPLPSEPVGAVVRWGPSAAPCCARCG